MKRTLRTSHHSEPVPHVGVPPQRTASCHPCWEAARRKTSDQRSTGRVGHWIFLTNSSFPRGPRYCRLTRRRNISLLPSICHNIRGEECAKRAAEDAGSSR